MIIDQDVYLSILLDSLKAQNSCFFPLHSLFLEVLACPFNKATRKRWGLGEVMMCFLMGLIFPDWGVIFISGSISGSFWGFIAFLDVFLDVFLLIYSGSKVVIMRISYSWYFLVFLLIFYYEDFLMYYSINRSWWCTDYFIDIDEIWAYL